MDFESIHISDPISSLGKILEREMKFTTSLNVIQKVMNVPMCALESILRANGYDDMETSSNCIDEKMLDMFAEAYLRKIKNYFFRSIRHINELSAEEIVNLDQFIKLFKKKELCQVNQPSWCHIDIEAIRESFIEEVKRLTPKKRNLFETLFGNVVVFEERDFEKEIRIVDLNEILSEQTTKANLLHRISLSRLYSRRLSTKSFNKYNNDGLRRFFKPARYHIISSDGDEPLGIMSQAELDNPNNNTPKGLEMVNIPRHKLPHIWKFFSRKSTIVLLPMKRSRNLQRCFRKKEQAMLLCQ